MNSGESFNFVGTKCYGLATLDMFVDTWICGFQIMCSNNNMNKYFIGILNSWIALPTKYMKLNVQRILMIVFQMTSLIFKSFT